MDKKNTWLVKICCVIAAFSLWLYIANLDNNQATQRITVPVTLTGIENVTDQKLKILPPSQQYSVTLSVKGSPTDIALGKDQFKVVADLSEYIFTKGERSIPVRVEKQPANVTVLNTETLVIKVNFDDLLEKSFPVKLSIDGKAKSGYYALQENVSPTDVVVSGAAKFVNQVVSVEANGNLNNSDKDLSWKLYPKALDASGREIKDVEITPGYIDVTVPVKRTKTVGINIKTKGNLSKDMSLKSLSIIPDKVDIAGGDALNNITGLDTEPIDLSTISNNKNVIAKIIVPDGVSLINSDGTVKVKATVEKVIQKNFTLDIQVKNLSDAFSVTLDNSKVSLTVSGAESQINALKNGDFNCAIDASSISAEGDQNINVSVTIPDGVTKVSQNIQTVKVAVKKKDAQSTSANQTQTNGGQ